eukprot:m.1608170 g.1608170  ORF g.1608170 m.1608170 type:complete len:344 (-) comp25363_c0_seq15:203-1234(-)
MGSLNSALTICVTLCHTRLTSYMLPLFLFRSAHDAGFIHLLRGFEHVVSCAAIMYADLVAGSTAAISPRELRLIVGALCRAALVDQFNTMCLSMMEQMMNVDRHIAVLCIDTLCSNLADRQNQASINLLRGTVFMLAHAAWGTTMTVRTLSVSPAAVLPYFLTVSEFKDADVVFEIVCAINALIATKGASLTEPMWDTLMLIIRNCMDLWDHDYKPPTGNSEQVDTSLNPLLDEALDEMERLYESNTYAGDAAMLFSLLEEYPGDRDMSLALTYKLQSVHPSVAGWLDNTIALVQVRAVSARYTHTASTFTRAHSHSHNRLIHTHSHAQSPKHPNTLTQLQNS